MLAFIGFRRPIEILLKGIAWYTSCWNRFGRMSHLSGSLPARPQIGAVHKIIAAGYGADVNCVYLAVEVIRQQVGDQGAFLVRRSFQ